MWYGPAFVQRPRNLDALRLRGEFEFEKDTVHYEREALINAMEFWLRSLEVLCGDRNITSS